MKISSDMERYHNSAGRASFKVPRERSKIRLSRVNQAIVLGTKAGACNSDGFVLKPQEAVNLWLYDKRRFFSLFGFLLRKIKPETLLHQTGEKGNIQWSWITGADLNGNR
jgi:hypothetical protein